MTIKPYSKSLTIKKHAYQDNFNTEEKHKIHRECNRIIFTFMQQKRNIFHSNILIFQIFSTNLQCK